LTRVRPKIDEIGRLKTPGLRSASPHGNAARHGRRAPLGNHSRGSAPSTPQNSPSATGRSAPRREGRAADHQEAARLAQIVRDPERAIFGFLFNGAAIQLARVGYGRRRKGHQAKCGHIPAKGHFRAGTCN